MSELEARACRFEEPLDEHRFRRVLGNFATGVSVVTAETDGVPVGMTIQSFCSLSLVPPLVLICPGRASRSWPAIERSGVLSINVLAEGQDWLARQFARSGTDKYAGVSWRPAPYGGAPILAGSLAWIDAEVDSIVPGGDHLLVTCRVRAVGARTDLNPLVFFRSDFVRARSA
ncbi:flavin reductase family protein [Kribbella hippodromi]|uniref:Flavin reductase family protein n=1 Tax=Kribbella hippodromi TaxID=434347 RepID=A0ABN2CMZ7_9ACTN